MLLLGIWTVQYKANGQRKAEYIITQDRGGVVHIHILSCNWTGCDGLKGSVIKLSTDPHHLSSRGWLVAKALHTPYVQLFMKREKGHAGKVLYTNSVTEEMYPAHAVSSCKFLSHFIF